MMVREGGCLCGKVRFALSGDPLMQAVCHCKNCQRQTGTSFSVLVGAAKPTVTITGALSTYEDHGESGGAVLRSFCPSCGSPVVSHIPAAPDFVIIKAGAFDDTSWIDPQTHFWKDSAQTWLTIPETATVFSRNPPSL